MHTLLQELLGKRNIKATDLTPDEKKTFDAWESKLTGETLSVETIADFCRSQINAIEVQWENLDNDAKKNERLVLLHTVYQKLLRVMTSDVREREQLEKYLTELIDSEPERTL